MMPPEPLCQPAWKRVLFREVSNIDTPLREFIKKELAERRRIHYFAVAFTGKWTPRVLSLLALLIPSSFLAPSACAQTVFIGTASTFAAAACLYFGCILLRRTQCSLLDFCVIVAALGNVEGLLVASGAPHALNLYIWPLALLLAAWVLHGAVRGIAMARLLNATTAPHRLGILMAAWLSSASLALLIAGGFLAFFTGQETRVYVTPGMARWGLPLFLAGIIGAGMWLWLHRLTARAALRLLSVPAQAAPVSDGLDRTARPAKLAAVAYLAGGESHE